jgi:hypothetical protein
LVVKYQFLLHGQVLLHVFGQSGAICLLCLMQLFKSLNLKQLACFKQLVCRKLRLDAAELTELQGQFECGCFR